MLETGDNIYTASLTLTTAAGGEARPSISAAVNGASLEPDISPNGWVTILGSGLTTSTRAWNGSDFSGSRLPTLLEGTGVTINGKDAFVQFIGPSRLNVLAPVDSSQGPVNVQVTFNGSAVAAATARMQQFTPAFFLFNNDKHIASTHADGSLLGPANPARPGEVIILYGTGFGPTDPPLPNGQIPGAPMLLVNPVTLRIGGVTVRPSFASLSAVGLYQINVQVPASAPNGDIPVIATIRGISSPLSAVIFVQR